MDYFSKNVTQRKNAVSYSMQHHQKNINSKGHLSAQHSMLPGPALLEQRPFRQARYRTLPCFTRAGRNAPKESSLYPGTHSTVLFHSSGLAKKPTLSRGQLPAEHFAGTATQAAAMEATLFFGVRATYTSYSHGSHCNVNVHFGVHTAQSQCVLFLSSIHLCGEGYKSSLSRGSLFFKIILAH